MMKGEIPYTEKQMYLYDSIVSMKYRDILATGSVQSGKTHAATRGFNQLMMILGPGDYLLVAANMSNVEKVLVRHFKNMYGADMKRKSAKLYEINLYGDSWFLHCYHGSEQGTEDAIRSNSYKATFLDERTLLRQEFDAETSNRMLSFDGGYKVSTCNPKGPTHWVKENIIDANKPGTLYIPFYPEDNAKNTPEAIQKIHDDNRHIPWKYQRDVLNMWVDITGQVYMFVDTAVQPERFDEIYRKVIAVDFGLTSSSHALLILEDSKTNKFYVADEWVYDANLQAILTADQQAKLIMEKWDNVDLVIPDVGFDASLRLAGFRNVKVADKTSVSVLEGINITARMMENGTMKINPACEILIKQLRNYAWNEKSIERGEVKPVKNFDHGPDAIRYYCHTLATENY